MIEVRPESQRERIKTALLDREPVDQVQAVQRGWGLRLAALIHRIRTVDGWPVVTEQDHRNGLARYRLPAGWQPPAITPDQGAP